MRNTTMIAIIAASGLAVLALAAAPAMAVSTPSTGTATASVTVQAPSTGTGTITITITSPASFSLGTTYPGQPVHDANAIDYTVTTDDASGFTVDETATDFVNGTNTIPATAIIGVLNSGTTINALNAGTFYGYGEVESPASVETFTNHAAATDGDMFIEELNLTPPASTAPGTYTSSITETASAN
jgi:hypothetical protein